MGTGMRTEERFIKCGVFGQIKENGMIQKPILLQAKGISKSYPLAGKVKQGRIYAINDLSLRIKEGECRGIVGESGCGKSTLLRILSGLEESDGGEVLYQNMSVFAQMKTRRNEIQMVFQNSMNAVNSYLSAEAILGEPLKNFGGRKWEGKKERREKAALYLTRVGLSEKDLDKYPSQFSGGQLQRICIARALAAEPRVLLLDEPLSSLDVSVQAQIIRLLEKLGKENQLTQVLVSHDLEAVYYLSDSLTVMYGGWVVEEIEEIKLFDQLCHPYTKRLVQASKGNWLRLNEQSKMVYPVRDEDNRNTDEFETFTEEKVCPYVSLCPQRTEICRKEIPPLAELCDGHWVRCFFPVLPEQCAKIRNHPLRIEKKK